MTKAQKIIKYFAFSLAIMLIISIFSTIVGIFTGFLGFSFDKETTEYKIMEITNKINDLDIDLHSTKLTIKTNAIFKVEFNNDDIIVKEKNNKLLIEEKTSLINNINEELIIYIPENYLFNEISIDSGAGSQNISELQTYKLEMDLGAGLVNIDKLNVIKNADIDTGVGGLTVFDCKINNLDLDIGIGKVGINGILTGSNEIDSGIGELEINLSNSINNYYLLVNKGLGNIKINGDVITKDYISNKGNSKIDIDGSIGNITINSIDRGL